jgi:hypothetical protein
MFAARAIGMVSIAHHAFSTSGKDSYGDREELY